MQNKNNPHVKQLFILVFPFENYFINKRVMLGNELIYVRSRNLIVFHSKDETNKNLLINEFETNKN